LPDNLIIGCGLIGLTTGLELLRRGQRVRMVDSAPEAAMGASFANGGLLTPSMADPWNAPGVHKHLLEYVFSSKSALKLRWSALPSLTTWGPHFLLNSGARRHQAATLANLSLSAYSLKVLDELVRDNGLSFDSGRKGTLKFFRSPASLDASARVTDLLADHGLVAETVSASRAVELEPCLAPIREQLSGGIYYPGDGSGDARLFSRAIASMFGQLGGVIEFNRTVESIEVRGGQVAGVRIGDEFVPADRVIIAGGVASPQLAAQFKLKLRVKPVKGYSITYTPAATVSLPSLPVVDDAYHTALTPLGQRLRVAGTAEFAGHDLRLDPQRVDNLARLIRAVYPEIMDEATLATGQPWAGLRPVSADGRPYIGRGPCPNLWVNTGHGHLGWTMAAGSARLLADLIDGAPTEIDASPFRLNR
jgi:D-amino-acid dehydrogenase